MTDALEDRARVSGFAESRETVSAYERESVGCRQTCEVVDGHRELPAFAFQHRPDVEQSADENRIAAKPRHVASSEATSPRRRADNMERAKSTFAIEPFESAIMW